KTFLIYSSFAACPRTLENAAHGVSCLYRCLEVVKTSQDTKGSFFTSLWHTHFFTISYLPLMGLLFGRIPQRLAAPSVTTVQCQTVLTEYNTSRDATGKLILQPRPRVQCWNLKQPFFKQVISKKPRRISFRLEKCKS
ncbi:unnamed protein product, partial [Gulo gulo]